jgi:hypothetical protein
MSESQVLHTGTCPPALEWAAEHKPDVTISRATEGGWEHLHSHFMALDSQNGVLKIAYPLPSTSGSAPEIAMGEELGISFRRGHKKCLFVSSVAMRCREPRASGGAEDALVLRAPEAVRELQRRVFQRFVIPQESFIAIKIWEGGVPQEGAVAWPLCSGRVANVSVGGVLVDVRVDQNPRLCAGDIVGIEITTRPGLPSICVDGQYRHCVMTSEQRLGLGFQFVGLEHDRTGRSSVTEVADFVRQLRRANSEPSKGRRGHYGAS